MTYTDPAGVARVGTVEDLPDESVRCYATAHQWDDPPATEVTGWGPIPAAELRYACPCGRRKRQVIRVDTGEQLTADYTGGVMLFPGADFPKPAARVEWLRRKREHAAAATPIRKRRKRDAS